jgi:uncharacterized protein YxjI
MRSAPSSPRRAVAALALAATGLALVSLAAAPASAAPNTVTVTLTGAQQGDVAVLHCHSLTDANDLAWYRQGSAPLDATATATFTGVSAGATCTIYYDGSPQLVGGVLVPPSFPDQTIGGWMSPPDTAAGYNVVATFTTDPTGEFTGAFTLSAPATVTGAVAGVADPAQARVRLVAVLTDQATGTLTYVPQAAVIPAASGAFQFDDVSPAVPYVLQVRAPGYPLTWTGDVATNVADPYAADIKPFTPAPGAYSAGTITLAQAGGTATGLLTGFGQAVTGGATNLVSGEEAPAAFSSDGTVYSISGLDAGVYLFHFEADGGRYASQIAEVGDAAAVNLTAQVLAQRSLGVTTTAIKGTPAWGQVVQAKAQTLGLATGLKATHAYTWITETELLATGAKLTVPNVAGEALYVVTETSATGVRPTYSVARAYGTVLGKPAPKLTFKIKGTAKVGSTLKVVKPSGAKGWKLTYKWLRGGKAIAKATKASYKLTSKDKGKKISVKVTYTKSGYQTGKATSAKTKAVAAK